MITKAFSIFALILRCVTLLFFTLLIGDFFLCVAHAEENSAPPNRTVKLVFVHHSVGENWLTRGNGNLGKTLGRNNYFVSDTNYGWGPDSIGDRTDILNWPEWFRGSRSHTYLNALYHLNDTNSGYSRPKRDPGGENQVVMFKSCFPNSDLSGRPDDPPRRAGGLSVGNAKAIYNDLLIYFHSRPDKLFIAVTAPPLLHSNQATNARAFNNWLVNEWLRDYEGKNVAVFDFYNVLTEADNHHRIRNGRVEHIVSGSRNTLHYSSNGDEHPTAIGNRKATEEFVPLLNAYYHRWKAWLISAPKPEAPPQATVEPPPADEPEAVQKEPHDTEQDSNVVIPKAGGLIDDFEGGALRWEVFSDESKAKTRLECGRQEGEIYNGKAGLFINYNLPPDSWATCSMVMDTPVSWEGTRGISVLVRMESLGQQFSIVAYEGNISSKLFHFEHHIQASPDNLKKWQEVSIPWDSFQQPPWEGDGTARFNPQRAKGVAIAIGSPDDSPHKGKVWVDDIRFLP
jgi:hypothetical protein